MGITKQDLLSTYDPYKLDALLTKLDEGCSWTPFSESFIKGGCSQKVYSSASTRNYTYCPNCGFEIRRIK